MKALAKSVTENQSPLAHYTFSSISSIMSGTAEAVYGTTSFRL